MKCRLVVSLLVGAFAIVALSGCTAELDNCERRNDTLMERINNLETEQNSWGQRSEKYLAENELLRTLLGASKKKVDLLSTQNDNQQETIKNLASMVGQNALPVSLTTAISSWADASEMIDFDEKTGMVKLKSDLLFNKGADTLQPEAVAAIKEFGSIINNEDAQGFDIAIVGHTDDVPIKKPETRAKHPSNWHLSSHRAISVENILAQVGVGEKRMIVVGFGEMRPIAENAAGNKGNEKNRRVEIYILPANSIFKMPVPVSE